MPEAMGPFGKTSLTGREQDILRLLANGLTDHEIADAVNLTVGTVKWYNRQIYNKLGVRNRIEAVTRAQQLNLLGHVPHAAVSTLSPVPKHNLPAAVNSFVGRNHELAELKALLLNSRLITLTGPPGTGKTRLALELASGLQARYPDGVYFISLAALRDANLVTHTIAQTLAIKEAGDPSMLAALKAAIGDKQMLLILDNFEHLLVAAPLVSDLLTAAPRLTILVTSREVLRLYGEQEFAVPPLQVPDLKKHTPVEILQSYEAVELFVQRACAAQSGFALRDENADSVAAICVQLDGLPLAIELAAARSKFYAPPTLLVRLSHRLEALSDGARDLPARQRTLRATLDWSYKLLTPEEQSLFTRLSVFVGGFTAADVEAVCGGEPRLDEAAGVESLLNKSLLRQISGAAGEPRFMMLETMREYAQEKLVERGETNFIREQHARYFLAFAERAALELTGLSAAEWHNRLESHHDNLRSALRWCLANDHDGLTSLRLVNSLHHFWWTRGYLSEGRAWLSAALRLNGASAPTQLRADVLRGAGGIAYQQCGYAAARTFYREALDIYQYLGDQHGVARTLLSLGDVEMSVGDYETCESLFQQGARMLQAIGDILGYAHALDFLAWCVLRGRGDYTQAAAWFEQALTLFHQTSDMNGIALVYSGLGEIALRHEDFEQATQLLEQSLGLRRQLGQMWGIAATLGSLALVAQFQGDVQRAMALLSDSLLIRKEIGDPGGMAWCLEKLAEIAHIDQDDGRAARILGAAAALRASVHSIIDPNDQPKYDRLIARVRSWLGDDIYEAVWMEGKAMSLESLIEYLALSKHSSSET